MTSTNTRPVDNVVITTKGLQDRNIHILDGTTVENKGKLDHYLVTAKLAYPFTGKYKTVNIENFSITTAIHEAAFEVLGQKEKNNRNNLE